MQIFNEEFVAAVLKVITDECTATEGCITAGNVAKAIGMSDEDHLLIRECYKHCLSDVVAIKMGPNGGFFLKSLPLKKKEKAPKSTEIDEEFISSLQEALDSLFLNDSTLNGIHPIFVAARLNLNPQSGARLVNDALKSGKLNGYTFRKGRGIIQGTADPEVNN